MHLSRHFDKVNDAFTFNIRQSDGYFTSAKISDQMELTIRFPAEFDNIKAFLEATGSTLIDRNGKELDPFDLFDRTPEWYESEICKVFDISIDEFRGNKKFKHRKFATPRQLHIWVMVKYFGMSGTAAAALHYKHHSTATYSIKTINGLLEFDKDFREKVKNIIKIV